MATEYFLSWSKKKLKIVYIQSQVNIVQALLSHFIKFQFNIILPSTHRSCMWTFSSRLYNQYPVSVDVPFYTWSVLHGIWSSLTTLTIIGKKYKSWLGQRSQYRDFQRAGRSGDRSLVEARYSTSVQNGPGFHPASCTMGTGALSRGWNDWRQRWPYIHF